MKKSALNHASKNSKISDFFKKIPGKDDHKRKLSTLRVSNEDNVTKDPCYLSPSSKKRKHDENMFVRPQNLVKTPTPTKHSGDKSERKLTPKKLFEKSPRKITEFNVEVMESFVKISPSTSNKIIKVTSPHLRASTSRSPLSTPTKTLNSSGVKQELKLESPSTAFALELENNWEYFFTEETEMNNTLKFSESQYCLIESVTHRSDKTVLKLKCNKTGAKGTCSVKGFWLNNNFEAGDCISIKGHLLNEEWLVDNIDGWLVYEPDLLISCTTVVNSLFCKRRTVLSEYFRGFEPTNRVMVVGTLVHTLLQTVLKQKRNTLEEVQLILKHLLQTKDTIRKLYECDLTINDIKNDMQLYVPRIVEFIKQYVTKTKNQINTNWHGEINGIDDIEENFWCPDFGIKGKIDVNLKTTNPENPLMPLEIKTGRATVSLEHRGQVILYIMMMNKFGYQVSSGLLFYLREGVLKEIKATAQEKRDVMILRNELAYYLTRKIEKNDENKLKLPLPISNRNACSKCPYNIICSSHLKYENSDLSGNPLQEIQSAVTSHLSKAHINYFVHWSNLLHMEEEITSNRKYLHDIYTQQPQQREKKGKCIINLKVVEVESEFNNLYQHKFSKSGCDNKINLSTCGISESSYVVVSTENRAAVATGFVTDISTLFITVSLDRNLNEKYRNHLFHIDTYDASFAHSFSLTSLSLLLEQSPKADALRRAIIDKVPPKFQEKLPSVIVKKGGPILKRLNRVQQRAVLKALSVKDYLLIKGMPGTGKSATIVALTQLLVELNKSVLITSHTHSAVDNICLRLQKHGIDFIRLGSSGRIDPKLKSHSDSELTSNCSTPEELQEVYNKFKVITATCLACGHPLFSKRTVDVCIVDESTQVLQSTIIKPLYCANTFILIGDSDQLAPVVRNREALTAGMGESLFERLHTAENTINLTLNYRMNQKITDLANAFTYKGQLKPATEKVATNCLKLSKIDLKGKKSWLLKALDTSLGASVQIIDTGPVWKLSEDVVSVFTKLKVDDGVQNCVNIHEAAIVVELVKTLLKGGISGTDIGVIATYTAQVEKISALLEKFDVAVSTVDQFQGRDRNVIIYSCTKSKDTLKTTEETKKWEILEDRRRLTVALTRAKQKLIIIGDLSTLKTYNTFASILSSIDQENVIEFGSNWDILYNL